MDFADNKSPEVDNNTAFDKFESNCNTWLNTSLPSMEKSGQKYLLVFDGLDQDVTKVVIWFVPTMSNIWAFSENSKQHDEASALASLQFSTECILHSLMYQRSSCYL